ncbi:heme oxygenase-like protein [Setomelanomma holmii]|uniref:Heme oxygenase-like protein n=1 Tax=Setomelanomma holmii TaxID=210430 RepID=A0A9P4H5B2_9PLEO|nr:heme oxygenase-like protein [Setomelanomma holmii]
MPQHHPGTFAAHNNIDLTDVPWALTTHLLSVNHDQLVRTTQDPFLARAANGTLPKALVSQWLANDLQYLKVYKGISEQTLEILRKSHPSNTTTVPENVETRLVAWLEAAIQNGTREENLFAEVAQIYTLNLSISESTKNDGLRRYEALFRHFTTSTRYTFLPWLEGAVLLWAMEKVYYDAWSWARRQDAQSSPRTFDKDLDGGAMRRELIPNWGNRDFLMFVEQLERIVNEGVSEAVMGDDGLWKQVKSRADELYAKVLDAEEVFWPNIDDSRVGKDLDGSRLGRGSTDVECEKCDNFVNDAVPVKVVA